MKAQINGKEFSFEANETILDVARRNGVFIPTLCELHDIDHAPGTCRICLVEVRRPGDAETEYLTACDTPLGEGWQVLTRTAEVQEMRRLQMEMTMADHHQDCSTCPRNGNCELLSVANSVGLKEIRFRLKIDDHDFDVLFCDCYQALVDRFQEGLTERIRIDVENQARALGEWCRDIGSQGLPHKTPDLLQDRSYHGFPKN